MTTTTAPRPVSVLPSASGQASADVRALSAIVELASLTGTIEDLNDRARTHLAARPTVSAHLRQAQGHLEEFRRALVRAQGTLEFNADLRVAPALRLVAADHTLLEA